MLMDMCMKISAGAVVSRITTWLVGKYFCPPEDFLYYKQLELDKYN